MSKKKYRFSRIISCVIVIVIITTALPMIASAAIYTVAAGTTSSSSPYQIGNWSIYNSYVVEFQPYETVAYLEFNASAGDKLAVLVSERAAPLPRNDCILSVTGPGVSVVTSQVVYYKGNALLPYYVARVDANNGSYIIQLVRTSCTDEFRAITVSFEQRIASASVTVSVSGTAVNLGNNPPTTSGSLSTIISTNLTNDSSIPNGAVVRTIKTTGTQTPSQGNVWHQLKPASSPTWFESTVSSNSTGTYNISISNGFLVKQLWEFRYRTLASAPSTMSNVKLVITYEYDQTLINYY